MASMPKPDLATNRKKPQKSAKSASKSANKPRGKPFGPNNLANPVGRPKQTEEELDLVAACKVKSRDALEVIEELMVSGKSDAVRLNAAAFVIERGFGKAVQPTENKHTGDLQLHINPSQALRLAAEVLHGQPK